MEKLQQLLLKNELIVAFLFVGIIMMVSFQLSKKLTRGKIPGAAIAITIGLLLAYCGG